MLAGKSVRLHLSNNLKDSIMSVMVISPQMIADVTKKAQTFRDYGFSHEEKMMCPTLAKMNDKDIKRNENEVKEFFKRLYVWNSFSYEKMYCEDFSTKESLFQEFEDSQKLANDIDIYQFQMILRFLRYNIEEYEFEESEAADLESLAEMRKMKEDAKMLDKIADEVCCCIVNALQEEKGCKWMY